MGHKVSLRLFVPVDGVARAAGEPKPADKHLAAGNPVNLSRNAEPTGPEGVFQLAVLVFVTFLLLLHRTSLEIFGQYLF